MSEQIKPCPFCGGEADLFGDCDMVKVVCNNDECQAMTIIWHDEDEEAIKVWNTRPALPADIQQLIDDAKKCDHASSCIGCGWLDETGDCLCNGVVMRLAGFIETSR